MIDPSSSRTTWDIIRSCFVTIFACIWLAVHPNIPRPFTPWYDSTCRRVAFMLFALVAPEMIVAFAIRQWWAAGILAQKYQSKLSGLCFFYSLIVAMLTIS